MKNFNNFDVAGSVIYGIYNIENFSTGLYDIFISTDRGFIIKQCNEKIIDFNINDYSYKDLLSIEFIDEIEFKELEIFGKFFDRDITEYDKEDLFLLYNSLKKYLSSR
jgi:hypothetical protein